MFNALVITGRVHTYPDIFVNGDFSPLRSPPPPQKKKNTHPQRVRIVFARPHENAKAMKIPIAFPQSMRNASRI